MLKRIVTRIRKSWLNVGIVLRGDAHYSTPEVHDWCSENDIKFVLVQTPNDTLWEKAHDVIEKAKELYSIHKTSIKLLTEFEYQAQSWSSPRRIIVKSEYTRKGANTRFIVTNLTHLNRRFIYQTIYCGRGAMELFVKEHKNHLASDRTSSPSFNANQFRFFLHSAAYILLHTFRELCLIYCVKFFIQTLKKFRIYRYSFLTFKCSSVLYICFASPPLRSDKLNCSKSLGFAIV